MPTDAESDRCGRTAPSASSRDPSLTCAGLGTEGHRAPPALPPENRESLPPTQPAVALGTQPTDEQTDALQALSARPLECGCHSISQLFREIQARGYAGGGTILRTFVVELRVRSGLPARTRSTPTHPLPPTVIQVVLSSRTLAWLSTQPAATLDEEQRGFQERLVLVHPTVTTAVQLAHRFATMVRDRHAAALDGWLEDARQSGITALRSLANGIQQDLAAVRAALTVVWSNGRTEGSVNRLKCVKRQMYGRGNLDLLRARLIAT